MKDFLIEVLSVVIACWLADAGIHLGKIALRKIRRRKKNTNYVR